MKAKVDGWNSHLAQLREVHLEGQEYLHLHCIRCGRDFVRRGDGAWRATHLGIFQFNLLDDVTNQRWTSESCTGRPLRGESNDKRLRPSTTARKVTIEAAIAEVPAACNSD